MICSITCPLNSFELAVDTLDVAVGSIGAVVSMISSINDLIESEKTAKDYAMFAKDMATPLAFLAYEAYQQAQLDTAQNIAPKLKEISLPQILQSNMPCVYGYLGLMAKDIILKCDEHLFDSQELPFSRVKLFVAIAQNKMINFHGLEDKLWAKITENQGSITIPTVDEISQMLKPIVHGYSQGYLTDHDAEIENITPKDPVVKEEEDYAEQMRRLISARIREKLLLLEQENALQQCHINGAILEFKSLKKPAIFITIQILSFYNFFNYFPTVQQIIAMLLGFTWENVVTEDEKLQCVGMIGNVEEKEDIPAVLVKAECGDTVYKVSRGIFPEQPKLFLEKTLKTMSRKFIISLYSMAQQFFQYMKLIPVAIARAASKFSSSMISMLPSPSSSEKSTSTRTDDRSVELLDASDEDLASDNDLQSIDTSTNISKLSGLSGQHVLADQGETSIELLSEQDDFSDSWQGDEMLASSNPTTINELTLMDEIAASIDPSQFILPLRALQVGALPAQEPDKTLHNIEINPLRRPVVKNIISRKPTIVNTANRFQDNADDEQDQAPVVRVINLAFKAIQHRQEIIENTKKALIVAEWVKDSIFAVDQSIFNSVFVNAILKVAAPFQTIGHFSNNSNNYIPSKGIKFRTIGIQKLENDRSSFKFEVLSRNNTKRPNKMPTSHTDAISIRLNRKKRVKLHNQDNDDMPFKDFLHCFSEIENSISKIIAYKVNRRDIDDGQTSFIFL